MGSRVIDEGVLGAGWLAGGKVHRADDERAELVVHAWETADRSSESGVLAMNPDEHVVIRELGGQRGEEVAPRARASSRCTCSPWRRGRWARRGLQGSYPMEHQRWV